MARIPSRGGRKPNYNEDDFGLSLSDDDDPFEDQADLEMVARSNAATGEGETASADQRHPAHS